MCCWVGECSVVQGIMWDQCSSEGWLAKGSTERWFRESHEVRAKGSRAREYPADAEGLLTCSGAGM